MYDCTNGARQVTHQSLILKVSDCNKSNPKYENIYGTEISLKLVEQCD